MPPNRKLTVARGLSAPPNRNLITDPTVQPNVTRPSVPRCTFTLRLGAKWTRTFRFGAGHARTLRFGAQAGPTTRTGR
jgi:hypothetical protein